MIIDSDTHWTPPVDIFQSIFSDQESQEYLNINKQFITDIESRIQSMHLDTKTHRQLLNFYGPTVGLRYRNPDSAKMQKMARLYNKHLSEICQEYDFFDFTSWLPLQDVSKSLEMLIDQDVQESFALHFGEQVPWGFIPKYQNVLQEISAVDLPVYLHFAGHYDYPDGWDKTIDDIYKAFLHRYPQKNGCGVGESDSWKITLASFILSGILEKLDLSIVVAEQGLKWIPEFRQAMLELSNTDPLPYFQKFFWFTTEPEEENFLGQAREVGFDRLLFATDWPHGNGDIGGSNQYHDSELINNMKVNNVISQKEYDLITHKNYLKLKNRV